MGATKVMFQDKWDSDLEAHNHYKCNNQCLVCEDLRHVEPDYDCGE